jgi:hypothetical protein
MKINYYFFVENFEVRNFAAVKAISVNLTAKGTNVILFEAKRASEEPMPHFILPVDELESSDATFNLQAISDLLSELNKMMPNEQPIKK